MINMRKYLIFCFSSQKKDILHLNIREVWKAVLVFSFLSICNLLSVFSQDTRVVFSHLDINNGISDNWVKCIYKDSKGFVWFGTNSGLNRFDGYKFEIYQHELSDSTSIADNVINAITSDKNGNLWIGTGGGVSVLNCETFKFRKVTLVPSSPSLCWNVNYITAMATDSCGNILIGTPNGLFLFNQTNNSIRYILIDEQPCSSQLNYITSIVHDKTDSFWIGTANGFIIKYNNNINLFEKFETFREPNGQSRNILKLFVDNKNNLWIADLNGLHLFNINTNSWDSDFQKKYKPLFANLLISGIDQDNDNQIWITTDGNGAFILDKKYTEPVNIMNLPYAEGSLSSNGLNSLYCDESGIVWIGTAKKGVDFYKKNIRKFRLYRNYPTDSNSLSNNDVNCITEDSNGNLWIGTDGGGLNYFNRKTDKFTHYVSQKGKSNSLSSNTIVSVFEDSDRKIWIGTYLGGLNCLDPVTGKITVFHHNDSDSSSLSDDRVWSICEDNRKNLWIATLTNGLNLFDRKTGRFKRFNSQNSSICFNYIGSIAIDEKNNLWISSAHGLIYYDPIQDISRCYNYNPDSKTSISDDHIASTFLDSRGLFWVCTNNGLNLMDRITGNFRVLKEADGLPSNHVFRIEEDNSSNLWISTKNGLSKLTVRNTNMEDSLSFQFKNYGISDGLQGKEFNATASLQTRDGELWFGGTEGLNAFYPLDIKEDSSLSKLDISDIRIDNKIVKPGELLNGRVLLKNPIFNTDKIALKYKENSFTIDFVALNYFLPGKNKYAYTLEGFSDKWIITEGKENFATFSNLQNGNYTFKVKGTNSDGIWNESPKTLEIRILPPFWKSWCSYIIYFTLIVSLLAFLRYLTLTRERMKMQMEQESIESQHVHEIDSMKINFFTNISHEFRTPLTLIFSPVEKLMVQWKNKPEEKYLNLIHQNARRLLFMVNQLLDFRKMEVQGFRYNPSAGNIVTFIQEVVSSFKDLSEQKHIQLTFNSDIKELDTLFDKDQVEKIMFNLLSNAFKFTPVDGKVTVTVSTEKSVKKEEKTRDILKLSNLIIKVEDSGIGIPQDKIDNLFVSFYQIESNTTSAQGSGIGLSLVKEFVKLHDGEIKVESESGKGSCFTVILPIVGNGKVLSENSLPGNEEVKYFYKPLPVTDKIDSSDEPEEKPKLLIADDNDDLRFYIKDNLQKRYNVYEAADGEEALAIIQKIIPDLIISDIMMPGIAGIELCRRVKADKNICHIPVILLTGLSTEQEQFESLGTGADDYILKPFNFQILEVKISNLISNRRSLKHAFSNRLIIAPNDVAIVPLDEQFIRKALDLIEKNISKTDYTVEELSRDLGMSRTLLYKKILALTGKPPLEFMRKLRLQRAAQLLQKSQMNISEITYQVGFNDPKYFRKHFKNEFGVLPSKYSEKFKTKQQ
jgi:signal transduction histidine kinase/ligand-binding sensor domain-containing protein/DNA-binding response OmpR family regulator